MIDAETSKAVLHTFGAVIITMVTAFVRITYDDKERKWQRKGLETVLCGLICLGCVSFSTYMGWDSSLNGFIGACVGFLGVDFIRDTARKLVNKKVD